jgi:hypothetical protein
MSEANTAKGLEERPSTPLLDCLPASLWTKRFETVPPNAVRRVTPAGWSRWKHRQFSFVPRVSLDSGDAIRGTSHPVVAIRMV